MNTTSSKLITLPMPDFFNPANAHNSAYMANPATIQTAAAAWRQRFNLTPVGSDVRKNYVLDIDDQFDFDFPQGSLFVAGRSGTGAMDALARRAAFVHKYLAYIYGITNTMDSHLPFQIFFGSAHLDKNDQHPAAHTMIPADLYKREYRPNPAMAAQIGADMVWLQKQFNYYCEQLDKSGKYVLYIWPYHCMIGSNGHRLAGLMEEARLFHSFARGAANIPEIKGGNPLIEHYSIFSPEVSTYWDGRPIAGAQKNVKLIEKLISGHRLFIMGEAASHCVKTSIEDLLTHILSVDKELVKKVVILRDCTTSVVVPGVADFTDDANKAMDKFQDAGAHVIDSTDEARIEELLLAA